MLQGNNIFSRDAKPRTKSLILEGGLLTAVLIYYLAKPQSENDNKQIQAEDEVGHTKMLE